MKLILIINKKKGFTLIELLIVVAIIGILAAVGVAGYTGYIKSTKVAVVKTQIKEVENLISSTMGLCMINGGGSMNLYIPANWGWPLTNPGDCIKSTMDNKNSGFVNHIDDYLKFRNVYESKPLKTVYSHSHRNPSQGYINLFWETDKQGKNYYVIYGNLGDHIDKNERYIEKRIYDWKE